VASRFEAAITLLSQAGAQLADVQFAALEEMVRINSVATIATAEAYQIHKQRLATRAADYDPFIAQRIEGGRAVSAADYAYMLDERSRLARAMDSRIAEFDSVVLPTTPIVAPTQAEVSTLEGFNTANRLLLRNTAIANFYDLCAISLPMPGNGLPAGLMLLGRHGHDRQLFRIAAAVEHVFRGD
jgi:aspartyl-tRNA(Asn)/glutamyl-tRNA(Gln) amidotransferase subunit A